MLRVCLVLALSSVVPAGVLSAQSKPDESLQVIVVEGEGAINNIRDHTARAPVIRVLDAEERPVAGATVNFLLPELGSGGTFPEGRTHLTTTTGDDGRAVARGLRPNNVAGRFQIRVSASWQGRTGLAVVNQVNVAPAARGKSKNKLIIAALVAGGAVGAVFAAKGSSSSGNSSSPGASGTTVTPGSPVFGPPK
ncbi:MAG TPA: hypothetical protein VHA11_08305 [Bryobacteraceae bacterium]|nr:hypothetical protein [Bryobacteraceae bacterium]